MKVSLTKGIYDLMSREVELLTVSEVAKILKVSQQYVRKIIADNKIDATRLGKQWVISPKELERYINDENVFIEPDDHERKSNEVPNILALSFFSGAMGLDIGMRQGGIEAVLACEFNKYCRMTIARNEPGMALIGDIYDYEPEEILKMAKVPRKPGFE